MIFRNVHDVFTQTTIRTYDIILELLLFSKDRLFEPIAIIEVSSTIIIVVADYLSA